MNHPLARRRDRGCRLREGLARHVLGILRCAGIAALLAVYADSSAEESFGRLFFTPEERHTLDDMRNDDVEPQPAQPARGETIVAPVVDVISFDGKVERSGGGGSTIWLNGRSVLTGNRTVEGITIYPSRGTSAETRFVLPPSDAGETDFSLKVGQKIAVQSGKVLDSYEVRAAEGAESVFANDAPADSSAQPEKAGTPAAKAESNAAKPAPGS